MISIHVFDLNELCKIGIFTSQKLKFSIKDFFSKNDQISIFLSNV